LEEEEEGDPSFGLVLVVASILSFVVAFVALGIRKAWQSKRSGDYGSEIQ
jgi:hypothetical protein